MKQHCSIHKKRNEKAKKKLRRKKKSYSNKSISLCVCFFCSLVLFFFLAFYRCSKVQKKSPNKTFSYLHFHNYQILKTFFFIYFLYKSDKQVADICTYHTKILIKKTVNDWCLLLNVQNQANKISHFYSSTPILVSFFFQRSTSLESVT
jgi:hypothetical protein